ncbi:MAG: winged helix-turn-helix transcriptional regulator [Nitrospirae bacterium]|nr:winged helix-turn-helix transcriptional regulator [Nitrospirota bacterium]
MDERIYELHADICQILANPKRLKIINTLRDKELSVNELAKRVGVTKANLSQHLSILRQRRIVLTRREGVTIHYRIANPKVLKAFDIMRQVLFEQLAENRKIYKVYAASM